MNNGSSLKGTNSIASLSTRRLIPNVSLIIFDSVFVVKHSHLVFKLLFAVLFLLVGNILFDHRRLCLPDGKRGESVLPAERFEIVAFCFYPARTVAFNIADEFARYPIVLLNKINK